MPEELVIRAVTNKHHTIITTQLNAKEYPRTAITVLYLKRWHSFPEITWSLFDQYIALLNLGSKAG